MGLTLHFSLRLGADATERDVATSVAALHARAHTLPFDAVSGVVRLDGPTLSGPWPVRGLRFDRLEDVVHVSAALAREDRYRAALGMASDDYRPVDVPHDVATTALGFAVAPGPGCEPATFGFLRIDDARAPGWSWHCHCKTQYASTAGDENLVRCHGSLVALLDAAASLGIGLDVHDEGGYWDSRDAGALLAAVARMNRIVARFAGALTDAVRAAGGDSRGIRGAIFAHPEFERLESDT